MNKKRKFLAIFIKYRIFASDYMFEHERVMSWI